MVRCHEVGVRMGRSVALAATLVALTALVLSTAHAAADPGSADPPPGPPAVPAAAAAPPAAAAAPPVDDGRVVSNPPVSLNATDGATLTVSAEDEIQAPVAPLTTAISTREYVVGGIFRGSISDSAEPAKGNFEVGYQIGCGIDMGTGPGILLGANAGANAAFGLAGAPGLGIIPIPNAGVTGGGSVTVSLKPGIVNAVPVTKKQFKGESPRVSIRNFRVRIDGCVGESFIRSYAILVRSTDQRETVLAWYGASKAV